MSYTFVEVCSGCGGLGLGLKNAGLKPILAIDLDPKAIEVYRKNVDNIGEVGDLNKLSLKGVDADLLVGGLPCQGFSTLGKKNPNDERNYLWMEFLRLLKECKPTAFLVENVPPFLKTFHFETFMKKVKRMGYFVNYDTYNALNYGVGQIRKRVIIIGSLNRKPEKLTPKPDDQTVRDEIGDLSLEPDGKNDHCKKNVTAKSLKRYKYVKPGGDRFDLPRRLMNPCWRDLKKSNSVFGRLQWDKPSVTIRTTFTQPECGRYIHPEADRPLTIREGARIQGFPDSFDFSCLTSAGDKTRLIGNAVPVPLAECAGKAVLYSAF